MRVSLGGRVAAPARRLALVGAVLATLVTLVGWPPGRPAYGQTAQPTATAATAATTFAIGGTVWFDRDGNGQREADEPLIFGAALRLQRDGQHEALGPTDADGTYRRAMLAPGAYTLQALVLDFQSGVPGGRALLASPPRTVALTGGQSNLDLGLLLPPAPPDDRYFAATGYRIDNDTIWAYFRARGGIDTFGYPVSRTFTFLGHSTQIFQRHIVQACCPVGWARPMNLLDPDLMPVSSVNFSTFPPHDPAVATAAPPPNAPDYGRAVLRHLEATVPDTWEGLALGFLRSYLSAAPAGGAAAPGERAEFAPLVALEVWGFPTSRPQRDPTNHNFVYQRFQRGILHFDAATGVTRGILLADTFKSVLTGAGGTGGADGGLAGLPADVAAQMAGSPYLRAHDPGGINGLAAGRLFSLGTTNLAFAFVPETAGPASPPTTPATPPVAATPAPATSAGPAGHPAWVAQLSGAIYFLRDGALWRYRFAAGRDERLLDGVAEFAVSPDGRRLAAVRGQGLDTEVWVAAADAGAAAIALAARQVTRDQRADADPVWSSRNTLAFVSSTRAAEGTDQSAVAWGEWCAAAEVRVWDEAGGLRSLAQGCDPAWSPDGTRLVYATRPALVPEAGALWPRDNAIRLVSARGENAWDAVQLRRDMPAALDRQRPGLFLHRPAWTPDGRSVLYARLVGYAALCDNSTLERTDSSRGGVELLGWVPDRVKAAAASGNGRYLALGLARCTAPGFAGYNTLGTDVLDLGRGAEVAGYPILGDTPDGRVQVAAAPLLRERRAHSPAWAPAGPSGSSTASSAGAVLAHLSPPNWPGADQFTPDPASPYNGTGPAELLLRDLATGQAFRLLERVDLGSPLAWVR